MPDQKALFFLRHYNDIDHITPVVYKWAHLTGIPARVVIRTDRTYLQDYRIRFLQQQPNVSVSWIGEFLTEQELRAMNLVRLSPRERCNPLRLAARLRENLKRRKAQARALDKIGRGLDPGEAESADSLESGLSKSAG